MNTVVVHPERCVGCMQCMPACATAHSRSGTLFAATLGWNSTSKRNSLPCSW